jgi:hypothetical protein
MTAASDRVQRSNKRYGWLRRLFSASKSATMTGVKRGPHSEEHKAKIAAAHKGKPKSPEHVAACRAAKAKLKGTKRPPRSEEWKRNHAEALRRCAKAIDKSFTQAPEYRAKQADTMRRVWAERKAQALAKERLQLPRT